MSARLSVTLVLQAKTGSMEMPGEDGDMEVEEDWQQEEKLSDELIFGQVGGLASCKKGDVTIFHRGERTWEPE